MSYRSFASLLALIALVLTTAASAVLAQSPGQLRTAAPGNSDGLQRAQLSGPNAPRPGREAKRWEPWSAMRTAAAPLLGWKVGIAADNLPHLTLFTTLERADAVGLSDIEASSSQEVNEEIPKKVDYNLQPGEIQAIQNKLFALNMRLVCVSCSGYRARRGLEPKDVPIRKGFASGNDRLRPDT